MHGSEFGVNKLAVNSLSDTIKNLSGKNRNRIRAMLNATPKDGIKIFNIIRKQATPREIFFAENALNDTPYHSFQGYERFPEEPQVKENYLRLVSLDLEKQARLIELYANYYKDKLAHFCRLAKKLNFLAVEKKFTEADSVIREIYTDFGYSHFLLRKACWIRSEAVGDVQLSSIDELLKKSGIGEKNLITSSIVNCFSESQDYLALRKSMLSLTPKGIKGVRNQFTRDVVRQIFQPHAKDDADLSSLIQSTLQSSLIDALICFKINSGYFNAGSYPGCFTFCKELEGASSDIDTLAKLYLANKGSEGIFFQKTGAWLESNEVVDYRLINDLFYDPSIGMTFGGDHRLVRKCSQQCTLASISEIVEGAELTQHHFKNLRTLQNDGLMTRSSVFNFLLFKNSGEDKIEEDALLWLMANTRDLYGTIQATHAKRLIPRLRSRLSQIIIYLLIIKRVRDDLSSNRLSRLLESEIIQNYNSDLMHFVDEIGRRYESVAVYLHEICTEDFLARLTKIVPETKSITDTRAALHEWRGRKTGQTSFLDRARAIRIDYKISLVRGEIDDNRIYVDPSRFLDWINDNIVGGLTPVLTSISHNLGPEEKVEDPQLLDLIARCYNEFCSNKHYGIASYIGRRIRHGTFKGQVFTNVVSIEKEHVEFLSDSGVAEKYSAWRSRFEKIVINAVNEKLHIETTKKTQGMIRPHLKSVAKEEYLKACMTDLVKFFRVQGATNSLPTVLLEYCWRIVEFDLIAIRSYIKEMKAQLAINELQNELRKSGYSSPQASAAFFKDLQVAAGKQFKLAQNWFKKPPSVSPKADVNLLYKAVIMEVKETFSDFNTEAEYNEEDIFELYGDAYHRIYDALFVIIYNAAKHGKPKASLERSFLFEKDRADKTYLILNISSIISDSQSDADVNSMLELAPNEDIVNAHMHENRSGIPKLHNLKMTDENFSIEHVKCLGRKVTVAISYRMAN